MCEFIVMCDCEGMWYLEDKLENKLYHFRCCNSTFYTAITLGFHILEHIKWIAIKFLKLEMGWNVLINLITLNYVRSFRSKVYPFVSYLIKSSITCRETLFNLIRIHYFQDVLEFLIASGETKILFKSNDVALYTHYRNNLKF